MSHPISLARIRAALNNREKLRQEFQETLPWIPTELIDGGSVVKVDVARGKERASDRLPDPQD